MSRFRPLAATGVLVAIAAPAAVASTTSHAKLWENTRLSVVCGIKVHPKNQPASEVLCSSQGIPRAKHGVGDPFVQIASSGKPQLVLLSQRSFEANGLAATLGKGAKWSSLGVTCTIAAKTVTCKNKSNHGFTIGNGKYKSF